MTQIEIDWNRPPEVAAAIQAGMQQADDNANHYWKRVIDGCVLAAARRLPELTVDDVLEEIEKIPNAPTTHNLAALGPAMKRSMKDGIIEFTGRVQPSKREEKHGRYVHVWRSRYYSPVLSVPTSSKQDT